jgi:hypothetical protein
MRGAIPPLIHTSWYLVKQKDNFIFYLYIFMVRTQCITIVLTQVLTVVRRMDCAFLMRPLRWTLPVRQYVKDRKILLLYDGNPYILVFNQFLEMFLIDSSVNKNISKS